MIALLWQQQRCFAELAWHAGSIVHGLGHMISLIAAAAAGRIICVSSD
jgi:hypothetical protein